MRDKELKRLLNSCIEEADEVKKDAFIRSIRKQDEREIPGFLEMLFTQARYIRWYAWLLCLAVIAYSAISFPAISEDKLQILSDLMPFLAGIGILFSFRSGMYGMEELERATLYSAKGALYARMSVMGIVHFMTMFISALLVGGKMGLNILYVAFYLSVPYLLTTILSMELERTSWGREHVGLSFAVALVVLDVNELFRNLELLQKIGQNMIYLIAVILFILQILEIKRMVKLEEYAWN